MELSTSCYPSVRGLYCITRISFINELHLNLLRDWSVVKHIFFFIYIFHVTITVSCHFLYFIFVSLLTLLFSHCLTLSFCSLIPRPFEIQGTSFSRWATWRIALGWLPPLNWNEIPSNEGVEKEKKTLSLSFFYIFLAPYKLIYVTACFSFYVN